jgi:hypothetical protein
MNITREEIEMVPALKKNVPAPGLKSVVPEK